MASSNRTDESYSDLNCDQCAERFSTFNEFKHHVPVASNRRPHLVCMYCKERYAMSAPVIKFWHDEFSSIPKEHFYTCEDCKADPITLEPFEIIKDLQGDIYYCHCGGSYCKYCVRAYRKC